MMLKLALNSPKAQVVCYLPTRVGVVGRSHYACTDPLHRFYMSFCLYFLPICGLYFHLNDFFRTDSFKVQFIIFSVNPLTFQETLAYAQVTVSFYKVSLF